MNSENTFQFQKQTSASLEDSRDVKTDKPVVPFLKGTSILLELMFYISSKVSIFPYIIHHEVNFVVLVWSGFGLFVLF